MFKHRFYLAYRQFGFCCGVNSSIKFENLNYSIKLAQTSLISNFLISIAFLITFKFSKSINIWKFIKCEWLNNGDWFTFCFSKQYISLCCTGTNQFLVGTQMLFWLQKIAFKRVKMFSKLEQIFMKTLT